ncbi:HU family DNA-binding protein [Paenibacillus sp. IB182496]|uniref:HU family DNA-binding protein n=1 Tax=Paenibacillus sabuli TaxID=2772509 RepID=A0A927GSM3_9BACL|nr:HU family DNA-binding protein [Paenibacillus sabuli]MBD2846436.1 HU family DNA-binding protein [Paenibacillus sabuli]
MNKQEMIGELAARTGLSKRHAGAFLDSYQSLILETLKKGEKIKLVHFGTYEPAQRAARHRHNPQAPSQKVLVPAHTVPIFKFAKSVKSRFKQ